MLIDTFDEHWQRDLHSRASALADGTHLYLLLDGVFVPGLHSRIATVLASEPPILLFESLPGCNAQTRDVSPFLMPYRVAVARLPALLDKCSGWPMVSAIETSETLAELAARLAVWCVVHVDGQHFNFRFPDTRRLPGIFEALTLEQRAQLAGPATRWSYIGRDGAWRDLPLHPSWAVKAPDGPRLDDAQFGCMVADSGADEMLVRLGDRGYQWHAEPSQGHSIISLALRTAEAGVLAADLWSDWCLACLENGELMNDAEAIARLADWRQAAA